ncbi:MAG: hypothetical protein HDR04_16615 [Lachnospiraceae bacterium]|nr:hypothetical protein [Lachnospiraceae bacterium]
MKEKKGSLKIGTAALLCVGVIFFAGCVSRDDISTSGEIAREEQEEQLPEDDKEESLETAEAPVLEEGVLDSTDAENEENSDEENAEKAQALYKAQIRHYYSGVLSLVITTKQLPDKITENWNHDESDSEVAIHDFALADIDQDGREELLIRCTISPMNNMSEMVYDYNPISGKLKLELAWSPPPIYYNNGISKCELHYNHEAGELRPFMIYCYQSVCDSYMAVASVVDWNKALVDKWWTDGRPFPDELDTDGDGILYNIYIIGEGEESYEYEDYKYNLTDFDEVFGRYTEGAKELSIEYQPMEYESFADFTPAYLKLLADEAGKERTDTASDLGLMILNEDHFLDAAKTLLSEKYNVELERPEPNVEERMVGLKDGREVFSFDALNAGHISYKGEQVDDVTIFGIYPGIRVGGAWRSLRAYGFYATYYGEVKNRLITGEGFGNVSIEFSVEDNVVTEITVGPYCAFAG